MSANGVVRAAGAAVSYVTHTVYDALSGVAGRVSRLFPRGPSPSALEQEIRDLRHRAQPVQEERKEQPVEEKKEASDLGLEEIARADFAGQWPEFTPVFTRTVSGNLFVTGVNRLGQTLGIQPPLKVEREEGAQACTFLEQGSGIPVNDLINRLALDSIPISSANQGRWCAIQ